MNVFQTKIPYDPFDEKALPGVQPFDPVDWLIVDDAYAGQMAERIRLLAEQRDEVLQLSDTATDAAAELLDTVVQHLLKDHAEFLREENGIRCPDGRLVGLQGSPLDVLCQLVQNDFCILQKPEGSDEHILAGAILCFPANWRLKDKFMRPLIGIHKPVDSYDDAIARRVQRLFDGVRVGRPIWRFNALWYDEPNLFQQGLGGSPKPIDGEPGRFIRSERQTISRLPLSNAMIFSIHTFLVNAEGSD
jgi:dimethylamine monooxygenase subunit A